MLIFLVFPLVIVAVSMILLSLFFLASKSFLWESLSSSVFECGFSSCFFSRFSFSIHYFLVALIFLFLDLELCLVLPMINDCLSSIEVWLNFFLFLSFLLGGLLVEWSEEKLEWKY